MLNALYGWYLKEELGCVFDTITFAHNIAGDSHITFYINDAEYGELKKMKLGTFNFIITRIFSVSIGGSPLEVEVMPDADLLSGFISIVYAQREVEPVTPVVLTMDLQLNVANNEAADTDMFMVFEGIWIPRTQMDRFSDLTDMVVTSSAKIDNQTLGTVEVLEDLYDVMQGRAPGGQAPGGQASGGWSPGGQAPGGQRSAYSARVSRRQEDRVPYCKRRRF